MKVKLRFFALYRELAGRGETELEVSPNSTLPQLRDRVKALFPRLQAYPLLAAVNGQHRNGDFVLREGDEVAFLPPFSGGQDD